MGDGWQKDDWGMDDGPLNGKLNGRVGGRLD